MALWPHGARHPANAWRGSEHQSAGLVEDLRGMVRKLRPGIIGTRDRALLPVGFAGAFRRSELVALDDGDLQFTSDGLVVSQRRSKTDQLGEGRKLGVPYGSNPDTCPVRSLKAWLEAAAIELSAVFRAVSRHGKIGVRMSGSTVAHVLKRYAGVLGLESRDNSGYSLRAGPAAAAAIAGASERAIMNQTGHRSSAMVRRYIRDSNLFRDNAAARVGL
jgi:integrase